MLAEGRRSTSFPPTAASSDASQGTCGKPSVTAARNRKQRSLNNWFDYAAFAISALHLPVWTKLLHGFGHTAAQGQLQSVTRVTCQYTCSLGACLIHHHRQLDQCSNRMMLDPSQQGLLERHISFLLYLRRLAECSYHGSFQRMYNLRSTVPAGPKQVYSQINTDKCQQGVPCVG